MGAKIKNNLSVGKIIRDWAAVITVIFLFAFFSVRMPNTFATSDNFTTIFRSIAVTTVMAMGLTMTLAVGGFDLSAGSTATMSSFIMMSFLIWHNVNVWLSILITIAGTHRQPKYWNRGSRIRAAGLSVRQPICWIVRRSVWSACLKGM